MGPPHRAINLARQHRSKNCAVANALHRDPSFTLVVVGRKMTYLRPANSREIIRFMNSETLRKEIIRFDKEKSSTSALTGFSRFLPRRSQKQRRSGIRIASSSNEEN